MEPALQLLRPSQSTYRVPLGESVHGRCIPTAIPCLKPSLEHCGRGRAPGNRTVASTPSHERGVVSSKRRDLRLHARAHRQRDTGYSLVRLIGTYGRKEVVGRMPGIVRIEFDQCAKTDSLKSTDFFLDILLQLWHQLEGLQSGHACCTHTLR
jgi:hypothetical protein